MGILTFFGLVEARDTIDVGAELPDVSVLDQDGKDYSLMKAGKEGLLFVFFYPKADTPGCTKQACSLRDAYTSLTEKKLTVIGVSADNAEKQKKFAEKYKLPFTLLADSENKVANAFGVPLLGKITKRQAFLFKDGQLVWRDLNASTKKQADDALAAVAELQGSGS